MKYFGKEIPPRCELHGCYLTDDGVHFYCTNFACNKHKHRRTKHTRYSRYAHLDGAKPHGPGAAREPPTATGVWPLVHFRCPACESRDIDMQVMRNRYVCRACDYVWR